MQSQLVKSDLLLIGKAKKNQGLSLGLFFFTIVKKNEDTRPKVMPFKMHNALNHSLTFFPGYQTEWSE